MSLAGFVSVWLILTREHAPPGRFRFELDDRRKVQTSRVLTNHGRFRRVPIGFRPADSVRRVRQTSMILADTVAATGGQEHR